MDDMHIDVMLNDYMLQVIKIHKRQVSMGVCFLRCCAHIVCEEEKNFFPLPGI
jgi:hypothetical protein